MSTNLQRALDLLSRSQQTTDPWEMQRLARDAYAIIGDERKAGGLSAPAHHSVVQHPPVTGSFVEPDLAPDRVLVVENTPTVNANTTSNPVRLEFASGAGFIIGIRGSAVDFTVGAGGAGPLEQASLGMQMRLNAGEELITNGVAADFATFASLFGHDGQEWFPLRRYVTAKDVARFTFRNFQLAGGSNLRPFLAIKFLQDPRAC